MKREVAVKKTGNFRRVCPMNGRRFTGERKVSVWDIALRAASIQTKQMRIRAGLKSGFSSG